MITLKDHDITDKFSRTYGIHLKFNENNCDFLTVYEGDFPRKVVLDVTTWKGMTPGALHYYGCLKISSLKCQDLTSGKINYLTANAPYESKGLIIELTRPLLKKDLLIDDGQRFKGARPGERIKNFDSAKQVEFPNDIVIPDFTISKLHASIRLIEEKYFCTDLNSTNGTLVAEQILKANEPQVLEPCDFITFGRLGFVFMPPEKIYELLRR